MESIIEDLKLNNQEVSKKIFDFLKKEFRGKGKTKAVLAISGGIDSAVCAFLCKKAELDLYALILPYKEKGKDGEKIAKELGLADDRFFTTDIAPVVDKTVEEMEKIMKVDQVDKGNIMARQRMIIQYALARSLGGLVVGTENFSEYYLGYFTLYGDQACDITPISGLFKTQVYDLARYLNVPDYVLNRKPSADLWEGQTDEKELGFSYEDADQILYLSVIKKYSKEKIIKKGFELNLVSKVLERVKATEFKRQSPPKCIIKIN
jgi:NAD+ synthase